MVLQLYLNAATVNSRKVLAGLKYMKVPFEVTHVDLATAQHKTQAYLEINPNGTVPSAKDGDLTIVESNVILQYAADAYGGHAAYPQDLKARSVVNSWLFWEASAWFPTTYTYLFECIVKPMMKQVPDEAVIEKNAPRFHQLAAILDRQLQKTKYIAGDVLTIADFAVASSMHMWRAQRLPIDEYPNLKRWMMDHVESERVWQDTQGPVDKALLPNATSTKATKDGTVVKATFHYTRDVTPQLTELYFYDSPKAEGIHEPGDDPQKVRVVNGWGRADKFTLDHNGFSLQPLTTSTVAWEDEDAVKKQIYPEIVEFLKQRTGASRVHVFDHTIRTKANQAKKLTQETNTSQRAPVTLVHCDYTAESAPLRVKQLLPDEADNLLKGRVAFVNVWKPINRPVEEYPLAMCDAVSVPQQDFFKLHLRYRDRDGENYVMRYSRDHVWYYFPGMNTEQSILLKTYDSDTNVARFVGHSAFEDPTSPPDAPTRESIEIRTILFF